MNNLRAVNHVTDIDRLSGYKASWQGRQQAAVGDFNILFSFSVGYLPGSKMMLSSYGIERS